MLNTAINRITSGAINQVNDAVVGMPAAPLGLGLSKFAGQLGNGFWMDDNDLAFSTAVGTVYAGHFRYVRLAAAALAVVVGQIVFWDTLGNAVDSLYQVTTSESGTTDAACWPAGIVLNNSWTPGNYSVVQDFGMTYTKFRTTLTATGHPGSAVFCAGAGGADLGFADTVTSGSNVTDIGLRRFLGAAVDTPTNAGLKRIYLNLLGGRRG